MGLLDCDLQGIERVFDPRIVNAVNNHPSIFPHISAGRKWPVDWSADVENHCNVFLVGEQGMSCFQPLTHGSYEMHIRIMPSGRGKWSLGFALASVAWMFQHPWVDVIVCRVPRGHYALRALVKRGCGQFEFTIPQGWWDEDGREVSADVYSMTRERWTRLNTHG